MKIGNRGVELVFSALGKRCHYVAAWNMFRIYQHPLDAFNRYLLGRGDYPAEILIKSSAGNLALSVYSYHDILTVNEIFCRKDYRAFEDDRVIVDFGSNIGISAAYFLTSAPNSFCYLFEPFPVNVDRLEHNLQRFESRYALNEVAVGEQDAQVEFGWEDTGRYGGVGQKTGKYISVPCRDSNRILEEVIARHGKIDILKIDIETLERQVTERIPIEMARVIDRVYVEYRFFSNPLAATHTSRVYGGVTQFVNNDFKLL
jgi:FkbM family methyltransferase